MNADTITAILNMGTLQGLSSQSQSDNTTGSAGMDFSSVLSSMLGTSTDSSSSALTGLTGAESSVDYASLLSGLSGGLRLQDTQSTTLTDALAALLGEKTTTDPVLAQLLQMMKGLSADAESDDIMALLEQMQERLMDMLEEDGAVMASQEALALISQLMPLFTDQATADAMTESLNTAGDYTALNLMLQKSPEELLGILSGGESVQSAQTAQTETQAQPQAPTAVLPDDAAGASKAQTDFAQVTGGNGTAGDPQPTSGQDVGEMRVASVETEGEAKTNAEPQTFAQMLETGKAQGNFAGAVRAVKEQMAENESTGFQEEPNVDELQRQADASGINRMVRTASVTEPVAEEVHETPQPVPTQLQNAITKAVANGEEQILVKLTPENLGEVTIQMQRAADGSLLLNIIAKNPETQRMLAADLAQLQQSLRPLNAEVESVTTEQQYQMANAQQQFGGQHQRSWQEMHGAGYYRDEPLSATVGEEQAPYQPQSAPAAMLDAYI